MSTTKTFKNAVVVTLVGIALYLFGLSVLAPLGILYYVIRSSSNPVSNRPFAQHLKPPKQTQKLAVPNYMGPARVLELPVDVLSDIAKHLSAEDISALTRTCWTIRDASADLWKAKVVYKYGYQAFRLALEIKTQQPRYSWHTLYLALYNLWQFHCADDGWGVIWKRNSYWQVQKSIQSSFGKSLNLVSPVWWLHVFRSVHVFPGTYRLVWGLQILPSANGIEAIEFNVKLNDDSHIDSKGRPERRLLASAKLKPEVVKAAQRFNDWIEVELLEFYVPPLEVEDSDWRTILVEVCETGQRQKSGLRLDFVRLERVNSEFDNFSGPHIIPYSSENSLVNMSPVTSLLQFDTEHEEKQNHRKEITLISRQMSRKINDFEDSDKRVY
ncbi:hypothetical protein V1512DRAFT_262889 [Lipomyces arxii]|uniref:uncharacterized protein n=1 Tax=Lipomyces arxii TaxID=56418 RepID=UPI0034CE26B4